jgi:hypothetical protein
VTQALISCPMTGDLVPTGIYVITIEDLQPSPYLLDPCSGCDGLHEWIREDAVLSNH